VIVEANSFSSASRQRSWLETVEIGPAGADIRLRIEGLSSLVRDLAISPDMRGAAA
jgi:hypothetical protein